MFYAYCISCCACKLSEKRTGKKKKELDEEEGIHLTDTEAASAIHEGLFFVCFNLQSF